MFFLEAYCGDIFPIVKLIKLFLNVLRIAVPIILILFITIDLVKAIISGSDDEFKKSQKIILKRGIYALAVFLTFTLVNVVMNIVANAGVKDLSGNDMDVQTWKACWNCKGKTTCGWVEPGGSDKCCATITSDGFEHYTWVVGAKTCPNGGVAVNLQKDKCNGYVVNPDGVCCKTTDGYTTEYHWREGNVCMAGDVLAKGIKQEDCHGEIN